METLAFHPEGNIFAMAGRLFKGQWNTAIWNEEGSRLYLAGSSGQPKERKDLKKPDWGRIKVLEVEIS